MIVFLFTSYFRCKILSTEARGALRYLKYVEMFISRGDFLLAYEKSGVMKNCCCCCPTTLYGHASHLHSMCERRSSATQWRIPSSTPSFSPFSAFFLAPPQGRNQKGEWRVGAGGDQHKMTEYVPSIRVCKMPNPRSNFFIFIFSPQASSLDFRLRPLFPSPFQTTTPFLSTSFILSFVPKTF